jgi:histidine triad (HIT) family protein
MIDPLAAAEGRIARIARPGMLRLFDFPGADHVLVVVIVRISAQTSVVGGGSSVGGIEATSVRSQAAENFQGCAGSEEKQGSPLLDTGRLLVKTTRFAIKLSLFLRSHPDGVPIATRRRAWTPNRMTAISNDTCLFCQIAAGTARASVVYEDRLTMAFVDLRQFHAGHTLVIPRRHFNDVRELDDETGTALMATVVRVTRAVGEAFANEGISLWHSIGEAAFQEVPHLHIHVHPRRKDDGVLRVYPESPPPADEQTREEYAARLRRCLSSQSGLGG